MLTELYLFYAFDFSPVDNICCTVWLGCHMGFIDLDNKVMDFY